MFVILLFLQSAVGNGAYTDLYRCFEIIVIIVCLIVAMLNCWCTRTFISSIRFPEVDAFPAAGCGQLWIVPTACRTEREPSRRISPEEFEIEVICLADESYDSIVEHWISSSGARGAPCFVGLGPTNRNQQGQGHRVLVFTRFLEASGLLVLLVFPFEDLFPECLWWFWPKFEWQQVESLCS